MKADQHDFTPVLEAQVNNGERLGVEQTVPALAANGIGSIIAGTDTTGLTLAIGSWSIYLDEGIRSRLHAELKTVWEAENSHPTLQDLERLPYLRACVNESLRFSSPISGRLPRITPQGGLDYAGHHIPAGTTISSAVYLQHFDEEVFAEPFTFNPDRWLAKDVSRQEQSLVPFSTGSRACLGLNLATAEIYIGLTTMIRWFKASRVLDRDLNTIIHFTRSVPGGLRVDLVEAEE
ncbi:uncharacterized protein A1O9_08866 [Exophiala aquamarina CBS 119918]|uniref:Cytochrome P450 oxidoreductase n=1 Tax=Exophiala aquamarina CBS 119918 TaxID=1182545 RepID=A0A072P666_9EURO|nr:uncharacterized protein A1O9_08866 [Exophiala aquamarina CBS 119918]KEF55212.1 hypothetical protein A1O9_08866 [Exophiala aquamarina CBS 119918]